MSSVSVSREPGDPGALRVTVGDMTMVIAELRVRPSSSGGKTTPHQIMGRGKAGLLLTDEQFVRLVVEYLRLTVTGWTFSCEKAK